MDLAQYIKGYFRKICDSGYFHDAILFLDDITYQLADSLGGIKFFEENNTIHVSSFEQQGIEGLTKSKSLSPFFSNVIPYSINPQNNALNSSLKIVFLLNGDYEEFKTPLYEIISKLDKFDNFLVLLTNCQYITTRDHINAISFDLEDLNKSFQSDFQIDPSKSIKFKCIPLSILPIVNDGENKVSFSQLLNTNWKNIYINEEEDQERNSISINSSIFPLYTLRLLQLLQIDVTNHIFGVGPMGRQMADLIGEQYHFVNKEPEIPKGSLVFVDKKCFMDNVCQFKSDSLITKLFQSVQQQYDSKKEMEEYVHLFDFPPFSISIPIASSYDFLSSLFSHLDMEHFEEDNNLDHLILNTCKHLLIDTCDDNYIKIDSSMHISELLTTGYEKIKRKNLLFDFSDSVSLLPLISKLASQPSKYDYDIDHYFNIQDELFESTNDPLIFVSDLLTSNMHFSFPMILQFLLRCYTHYPIMEGYLEDLSDEELKLKSNLYTYLNDSILKKENSFLMSIPSICAKNSIDNKELRETLNRIIEHLFDYCHELYQYRCSLINESYKYNAHRLPEVLFDSLFNERPGSDLYLYNPQQNETPSTMGYFKSFLSALSFTSLVYDHPTIIVYILGSLLPDELLQFELYIRQNHLEKKIILLCDTIDENYVTKQYLE